MRIQYCENIAWHPAGILSLRQAVESIPRARISFSRGTKRRRPGNVGYGLSDKRNRKKLLSELFVAEMV